MYIRNCPKCKKELKYKNKYSMFLQEKNKKLCKSCTVKNEYKNNPNKNKGSENGRFGLKLMDIWIENHGLAEANKKYNDWKSHLNKFKCGADNPQYGKSPFLNGGMSYKGWYKDIFFRSSLELLFIINYESTNNDLPLSADNKTYSIEYNIDNTKRHYYPDFLSLSTNTIYEIKSKQWLSKSTNQLKIKKAKEIYTEKNINYEVLTENDIPLYTAIGGWQKVVYDYMYNLILNDVITLTDACVERIMRNLKKLNKLEKLEKLKTKFENK